MMKHSILVLEDDEERIKVFRKLAPPHEVTIITAAEMTISFLRQNAETLDVVFLDHDLGGEQFVSTDNKNTGSEVARFMASAECGLKPAIVIILHTLNPAGERSMRSLLRHKFDNLYSMPFTKLRDRILNNNLFSDEA